MYSLGRHDENGAKCQSWTLIFHSHSPVDNRVNRDFDTVQVCRDLCSFVLLSTKILSWVGVRMLSGALSDATYGPKFWLPHKKNMFMSTSSHAPENRSDATAKF